MKISRITLSISILILSACNKHDHPSPTNNSGTGIGKCILSTVVIPDKDGFDLADAGGATMQLFYNSGFVDSTSWNNGEISRKYIYTNKLPVHIQTSYRGAKGSSYDITYNAAGKPKMVSFTSSSGTIDETTEYQYGTSGEMTRKVFNNLRSNTSSHDSFAYSSGNLINVARYSYKGILVDSYTYTYTSTNNKLALNNSNLEFILHFDDDMESLIYDGLLADSKLISSVTYTEVGKSAITYNITYDLNANGYPETVKANGKTIITFNYDCN